MISERQATLFALTLAVVAFVLGALVDHHYVKAPRVHACVIQATNGTLYVPACDFLPSRPTL